MAKSKRASKTSSKTKTETKQNQPIASEPVTKVKKKHNQPGDALWAMFLIFIGIVLLGNTTGVLPWSIWSYMYRFWPFVLIFVGLHIILGKNKWANLLINILGFFVITSVFTISLLLSNSVILDQISVPGWIRVIADKLDDNLGQTVSKTFTFSTDEYKDVERLILDIETDTAQFEFSDFSSGEFMTLDADYFTNYGEPQLSVDQEDGQLTINVDQQDFALFKNPSANPSYDFKVGSLGIPTELNVEVGAGSGYFDIENLILENFNIEVGAGSIEFNLGRDGLPKTGKIEVGAGRVVINIPDDVAYRIRYSGGLGTIKLAGKDLPRIGEENHIFESDNFSDATYKLDLELEVGVGIFELNTR